MRSSQVSLTNVSLSCMVLLPRSLVGCMKYSKPRCYTPGADYWCPLKLVHRDDNTWHATLASGSWAHNFQDYADDDDDDDDTPFMALWSWHCSHCESSLGSVYECRTAVSRRRTFVNQAIRFEVSVCLYAATTPHSLSPFHCCYSARTLMVISPSYSQDGWHRTSYTTATITAPSACCNAHIATSVIKQEAQPPLSNRASAIHFAVAQLLSISITETSVTETYVRYWLH